MYGTPEYGQDDDSQDPYHLRVKLPPPKEPAKEQSQVGVDGHVDNNPSPVMGTDSGADEQPFIADPYRMMQAAAARAPAQNDFNPSPDFGGERRHQSSLLDDPGINKAIEDNPAYKLPKMAPMPAGGNALIEHYLEEAMTGLGNGDKVHASQMVMAAKTLVMMVRVQAERTKNELVLAKMKTYLETCAKVEQTINA